MLEPLSTEIKPVNVARASLEELLEDYKDFIRNNGGIREKMYQARKNNQKQQLPCL